MTLLGLTDTPSEVMDTLVGTRRSRVLWVAEAINQWTLCERPWTLRWFMSTEDKVPVADFLELLDIPLI